MGRFETGSVALNSFRGGATSNDDVTIAVAKTEM
jgi:hypothetical protein